MSLPEYGRVVIIDDNIKEVEALIKVLSKHRTSITYFTGANNELPDTPFPDVRIVFLDVVLEGLTGKDTKTIVSTLIGILGKIVDKNNGPFVIVLWTKHPEHVKGLKKALKTEKYKYILIDLEKKDFFDQNGGFKLDSYDSLRNRLNEKIAGIDIFDIFIIWENIMNNSAGITVNDFSQLIKFNDNWNNDMKNIFYKMAEAWAGKTLKEQNTQKILKNALFTFNGIFNDIFEGLIQNEKYSAYQGTFSSNNINEKNKGRINIKLLLDFSDLEKFYPGDVYRINKNAKNSSELLKDILDINKINDEKFFKIKKKSIQVFAEVTPLCDFLQEKIKLYRVIEGFIIPEKYKDEQNIDHYVKIKKAEFIYKTPVFTYKNEIYRLILDFKYFSSKTKDELKNFSPIFRLRKELLNDIQIKLSSHINRTGILFID
ncbi:MAG: hypothetical protein RBR57_00255 [Candidatus Syntrophosphaera sp.]|jgi:hypothetical protein|nr:hypothetical protein [Candidatus Cloacimonadota bacterium]MDY0111345.1 hypothetical protein [Candidatus Syntrophosphaera sp.]